MYHSSLDYDEFCELAEKKGRAVKIIKDAAESIKSPWMVTHELENELTIEIRAPKEQIEEMIQTLAISLISAVYETTFRYDMRLLVSMKFNP